MDFTVNKHHLLLLTFKNEGYSFQSVSEFIQKQPTRVIILRYDVEKHYENALKFAQIQSRLEIKATYYFRFSPRYYNESIIKEIAGLGHEIGYHYDDLSKCNGDYDCAIERFRKNLESLRKIALVKTICMDGSPLSKHDNLNLWKKYNYKDFGIEAEPYLDIDFNEVFYLTDTGRRWDGGKVSVRDRVQKGKQRFINDEREFIQGSTFHSTNDIIQAAEKRQLPDKLMLTFHPQRWTDKPLPWVKELIFQNTKNIAKRYIVRKSENNR